MREFVMSELYKLMIDGRGAETDVVLVLNRIQIMLTITTLVYME